MTDDGPWLNVPQAVVLEVTRDIELAVGLTAETTALLVIKANQLLARRTEIPLEADADDGATARRPQKIPRSKNCHAGR